MSPSAFDTELLLVLESALIMEVGTSVECLELELKCAESGSNLGVDNISSDELGDLLLASAASPFFSVIPMEPPPRPRPVILLVANMSLS